jgi:glucose/arabinose dehydrogenase
MKVRWMIYVGLGCVLAACAPNTPTTPSVAAPTLTITFLPPTQNPTATSVPPSAAPTPTAQIEATPTVVAGNFNLGLESVVSGLQRPTYVTTASDDSGRLFVVEQPGRIRIVENGQLLDQSFLDIIDLVSTAGNERGLLSVAFRHDYKTSGQFFVDYTRQPDGATIVARYNVSAADPDVADRNSGVTILEIDQPESNHNGGQLQFGPDGYLYVGTGDGGGQGDQHGPIGNGQNLNVLLGKILRLDVNGTDTYQIPATNPFVNRSDARPEIWAYGLRNPWRFSFDRATNDLYIADVGQDTYEEIDFQPASDQGGENYGWRIMEGLHCYNPGSGCDQTGLTLPIAEYTHAEGGCSVTGGYVYRGTQYPAMQGVYFFADYCSGKIWSLQRDAAGQWQMIEHLEAGFLISSFGQDQAGELYVVDHGGAVNRLVAR